MNPGGLRDDLRRGELTRGDLFKVLPSGNALVTVEMTGAQITELLEARWRNGSFVPLQLAGLRYSYGVARPVGSRVVEIRDERGAILQPHARYTLAASAFLAEGGDGFAPLARGTPTASGAVDLDALAAYVRALGRPFCWEARGSVRRLP